jgi:uncharacterized protein YabE (DUF348 family)
MNIPSRLNKLHSFYGKAKYAFLTVFVLTIMFTSFVSDRVYGDSVVGTVETKIVLKIDGKIKNIITTQNTIDGALAQNNIALAKNDITEPPLDTYLSGKILTVNVVRAIPVLISDNGQSWAATSAYTEPQDILKQLDVEVFPEDSLSAELILEPVLEGAVGQKIFIKRAPTFTVIADGGTKIVHSWADTIAGVLAEKSYILRQNDLVEPARESSSVNVDVIEVTRINFEDIEMLVLIDYETITKNDYNLYKGQSKVTQGGVTGQKKQSVHIVYENNVETSRTVMSSDIINSPVSKIILVGVKPYNAGMWWDTLVAAGSQFGVDPADMYRVMLCESGGNPYAGGTWKGLFQYHPNTWAGARAAYPGGQYAGAEITNGTAQIYVTAWKVSKNGWSAWTCKP